jgi:hypothetical protein
MQHKHDASGASLPPRLGWRTDGPPVAPSLGTHRRQPLGHPRSGCPSGCYCRHQPAGFPWFVGCGRGAKPRAEADVGIGRHRRQHRRRRRRCGWSKGTPNASPIGTAPPGTVETHNGRSTAQPDPLVRTIRPEADVAYVCDGFQMFSSVFASVSDTCFKCFLCFFLYVATIASGCFQSRSGVAHRMRMGSGRQR